MSDDSGELTGHNYDGIEEYDNPLPAWWLATFFITIIFGFLYWIHYEFGGGQTQQAELAADLAAIESLQAQGRQQGGQDRPEDLNALLNSAAAVAKGSDVYSSKCAACHGPELQGLIGPNLVDDYWIHGKGKPADVASVIRRGVPDKGMPPWDGQIKEDEIKSVTVFIVSKYGSAPANPKAPQGEKVVQE